MSLIKSNRTRFPWRESLEDFFNQNTFFNNDFFSLEKTMPSMNVKEHEEDFEIELAAPGFEKDDFEITIKDDVLEVSAERKKEEVEEKEDYTRREFGHNAFKRSVQLPTSVDRNKDAKATYKNGILRLKLLKREEEKDKPKKVIEVV